MHFFVASRSVVVRFSNERTLGKTFDDNAPPVAPKVFDKKCENGPIRFNFVCYFIMSGAGIGPDRIAESKN